MKKHWTSSIALGLFTAVIGCGDDTQGSPDTETTEQGSSSAVGDATGEGDSSGPGGPTSASSSGPSSTTNTTNTTSTDGSSGTTGEEVPPGDDVLRGYWVWEKRVQGTEDQLGDIDNGQQKIAFGTGNDKCHYIWNELTGSDFHTECTYAVEGDMVTFMATADPDGTAAGYSCAHPDWTDWNDRPAVQYSRYQFVGDRLWLGVNTYWGFGGGVNDVPPNGSLKRFPFWESQGQAETEESWIVFMPVTREEWFSTYAISTTCQGTPELCAQWPGCGPGDHPYVD